MTDPHGAEERLRAAIRRMWNQSRGRLWTFARTDDVRTVLLALEAAEQERDEMHHAASAQAQRAREAERDAGEIRKAAEARAEAAERERDRMMRAPDGVMLCPECSGEESMPTCMCRGVGWMKRPDEYAERDSRVLRRLEAERGVIQIMRDGEPLLTRPIRQWIAEARQEESP